jgi:uridine kinase
MKENDVSLSKNTFTNTLFMFMQRINKGIGNLELYEFQYGLDNLTPVKGWESIKIIPSNSIEKQVHDREFFLSIKLKPIMDQKIVLDQEIVRLTQVLFRGLVEEVYSIEWVNQHFYFDLRGFLFFPRTNYFTSKAIEHFGGKPAMVFSQRQTRFEQKQDIGYKEFRLANAAIDDGFIQLLLKLFKKLNSHLMISLSGPTGAGKTEITQLLQEKITGTGKSITTIEVDNFLKDREFRDEKPMGREAIHFDIFLDSLERLLKGEKVLIPRYDFVAATSSHDPDGNLKSGCKPIEIIPADIIFLEGNFPFQIPELAEKISIKVVYLTDDPVRLKRKWKRDIDYRKKYDPAYFINRFFRTQFLRADECYKSLIEVSDLVVDTTKGHIWITPALSGLL